jgi:hypothetical protein
VEKYYGNREGILHIAMVEKYYGKGGGIFHIIKVGKYYGLGGGYYISLGWMNIVETEEEYKSS